MYLEKIPNLVIKNYNEFTCNKCYEKVDSHKAKVLGWTHYPEATWLETYCPSCTKDWNQYQEEETLDGR